MVLVEAHKQFQPEWDEEIERYIIPEKKESVFCFDDNLMIPKVDDE